MHRLLVVAHVAGIAVYLGATVFLGILVEVVGRHAPDAAARRERWAEIFGVYNPLAIAALGVVVMTGAWAITPYKEALGKGYFEEVGRALANKLGLAFVVVITGTWISFGMCHRLVRAHQGALPVTDADLDKLRMRLRVGIVLACALTMWTTWVAMGIHTPNFRADAAVISFELLSPGKRLPADYWSRTVPGAQRTEVEIGPGDGRFLIEAARRDPATAWVGLEIRVGLARKLAERSDRPANAFVHQCDARWIVEHLLADASVDAFHLYFPDPWWKKRHYKRRLIGETFAAALVRCLKAGGRAYVLSDVEAIFADGAQRLEAAGLGREEWSRAADDPAQSSYERKYRRQGRRLYQARFAKAAS